MFTLVKKQKKRHLSNEFDHFLFCRNYYLQTLEKFLYHLDYLKTPL